MTTDGCLPGDLTWHVKLDGSVDELDLLVCRIWLCDGASPELVTLAPDCVRRWRQKRPFEVWMLCTGC